MEGRTNVLCFIKSCLLSLVRGSVVSGWSARKFPVGGGVTGKNFPLGSQDNSV